MYTPDLEKDRSVIVFVVDKFGLDHYTTGKLTGNKRNENYELILESPYIEEDKGYFHKEDLYELTDENIDKYID